MSKEEALLSMGYRILNQSTYGKPTGFHLSTVELEPKYLISNLLKNYTKIMSELKSGQSISEYFQEKYDLSKDQLLEMSHWRTYQDRIQSFCIKNNLDTFQDIFGQEEGLRLLQHFRSNCKEDFSKFLTYITLDQHNDLQAYIIKNY